MAEIVTVDQLDMNRLRNSEFGLFAGESSEIIGSGIVSRNISTSMSDSIIAVLNVFNKQREEFDMAIISLGTSQHTIPITTQDHARDTASTALRIYVDAYILSPDTEMAEAARRIRVLIDNYGNYRQKSYNEESSDILNFLEDMDNMHSEDIEKINAGYWVENLREQNHAFMELMKERYDENVNQSSGKVRGIRTKVGRTYRQLTGMLEAGNVISEGALYVGIIKQINERVAYYKTTLAIRKGRADAKKDSSAGSENGGGGNGEPEIDIIIEE